MIMENRTASSSLSSALRTPSAGYSRMQQEIRSYLNQIVNTCELMKLEVEGVDNQDLIRLFDAIRTQTLALSWEIKQFFSVPDRQTDERKLRGERVKEVTGNCLDALRQIQTIAHSLSEVDLAEDLVRLEFAVYHLQTLADQFKPIANLEVQKKEHPALAGKDDVASAAQVKRRSILVVDDDDANRNLLERQLRREKHDITQASSGQEALQIIEAGGIDLMLLDMVMPGIHGFEVLRFLKSRPALRDIPVIMISGVDEIERVAACIDMGADDYVLKPFNSTLLRARIRSLLERKQERDQEKEKTVQLQQAVNALEEQKQVTERLLLNILPHTAAEELKTRGSVSPTYYEDVTIVFTDFVNFTASTEKLTADDLVNILNEYFTAFDEIMDRYGLEKLKTVGDSYIFLSGIPEKTSSHPVDAVLAAMEMLNFVESRQTDLKSGWAMRIGMHTGPVIAGVVGTRKFAFDVWGDSINFASRMVMAGAPNQINLSDRAFQRVKDFFSGTCRGPIKIKGNRVAEMYFVDGILPSLVHDKSQFPPAAFQERYFRYFRKKVRAFPRVLAA